MPSSAPPSQSPKPILIAGAGIASLLLAQSLRRSGIPFVIFERETSLTIRSQGYRLRLSAEGLDAIETALGEAKFAQFWETCGKTAGAGLGELDALTGEVIDRSRKPIDGHFHNASAEDVEKYQEKLARYKVIMQKSRDTLTSREGKVVGIARGDMRRLFMEGCEEFVVWGRSVVGYETLDEGVRAVFADGEKSVEGSLLVGGEGIYSKTAKQVSNGALKVYDLGARGIHGQAPTTAFKGLGEGVFRIVDDSRPKGMLSVITNVRSVDMDDPDVIFGWTMTAEPGVITPPNDNFAIIGKTAADIARDLTKDWHPRFQPFLKDMIEPDAAFWKITCSTPTGVPQWQNDPRVTVIGDAAHSMTPAGGIGANTAVRDSALLGQLLGEKGGWWNGVTEAFEKEMRVYASEAVEMSYGMATVQFGVDINEDSKVL